MVFVHSAFLYDSDASYAAALALFAREGLAREQSVAVAAAPDRAGLVREALGGDARSVRFLPADEWYARPVRTIAGWVKLLRSGQSRGRTTRLVGETPWTGPAAAWTRYEAALNRALSRFDGTLLCPYDLRSLPPHLLDVPGRTHPRVHRDGWRDSTTYEPARVLTEVLDQPWPVSGPPAFVAPVPDTVAGLRATVRERAVLGGWLPPGRLDYLVLAVCELATNSVRHGGTERELTVWVLPDAVVCEVTDTGGRAPEPFAGYLPPVPGVSGGMGLWLVHQLCDGLTLRREGDVTRARFGVLRAAAGDRPVSERERHPACSA
ncbi:anti-sigma factor RsbA family regulatory protein [Symbioplanes lichenis]|uniref:anti-sigma factor RsbA family regulatory protein n=1 Tax=Symbioplanes lichenis TaxID=1629072 RepID=UPI002739A8B1|nr:anti-sigma factor RsbA family regulatory protein [Actinoplanes lichenis]